MELKISDEIIFYVCLNVIFRNFAIAFNVKASQLGDALARNLYRKPTKIFYHRRKVSLAIRRKDMKS